MIARKKHLFFYLSLPFYAFAVLVLSFCPLNASAIDLVQEVNFQDSGSGQLYHNSIFNNTSYNTGWINSSYTFNQNINLNSIAFRRNNNTDFTLNSGWFLTTTMYVNFKGFNNQWNSTGLFSASNTEVSCPIIDIDDTMVETHSSGSDTDQRYTLFLTCKYNGSGTPRMNLFIKTNNSTQYQITYNAIGYSIWSKASNTDYTDDIAAVKNAVNSMKTSIENKLNTTNNKLDAISEALEDTKALQEQANQDAQDRYDDEKQTIQDNADSGQQAMEDLQNNTSFSVPNPLSIWFGYFTNGCSTSIPTIASWLNAPSSTYTSWWCTSSKLQAVRNSSTTVLSVIGVCLVFGFCIKWLRTNQGEI